MRLHDLRGGPKGSRDRQDEALRGRAPICLGLLGSGGETVPDGKADHNTQLASVFALPVCATNWSKGDKEDY